MSTQVAADIRTYVVDTWLSGDGRGLADDTDLQEAGALDSLSALALVSFLETTYEIQLEPADIHLEAFRTVNAITALVARKTAGEPAGG